MHAPITAPDDKRRAMDANPSIATLHLQRPTPDTICMQQDRLTSLPTMLRRQKPILHSMKVIYFTVGHKFQLLTVQYVSFTACSGAERYRCA